MKKKTAKVTSFLSKAIEIEEKVTLTSPRDYAKHLRKPASK
jgi:hypothetical protein